MGNGYLFVISYFFLIPLIPTINGIYGKYASHFWIVYSGVVRVAVIESIYREMVMKNEIRSLQTSKIIFNRKFRSDIFKSVVQAFSDLCKNAIATITADPNELQVVQKLDRHGNTYWQAYDPATGKSFSSGSEADVSMWIEQLYKY
ncbi:hypothetical protein H6G04_23005 [Calothrix membranacea FACHB-236]|nr:hypothetical protein [Calothrix membranacea FACHB-236]